MGGLDEHGTVRVPSDARDTKQDPSDESQGGTTTDAPFGNILNFRDVGKTINELLGEKRIAEGLIFRSARPDDATLHDRERLVDEYGIKTIIDLRTLTEHQHKQTKRQQNLKDASLVKSNPALLEPMKIPGIDYQEINLNGSTFEKNLVWQLSWWSLLRFLGLIIMGYRMDAISILGREVMAPKGLVGLGKDTLNCSGPEIAQALRLLLPTPKATLIHCTQGKDRTGLLILLILLTILSPPSSSPPPSPSKTPLTTTSPSPHSSSPTKTPILPTSYLKALTTDYTSSTPALESEYATRMIEISSIGLGPEFASCPENWVGDIVGFLGETWGGVEGYLDFIGFGEEERRGLREGYGVGS